MIQKKELWLLQCDGRPFALFFYFLQFSCNVIILDMSDKNALIEKLILGGM